MAAQVELAERVEGLAERVETLEGWFHEAFTPRVSSMWTFSDVQKDIDIKYDLMDYGALITRLDLASAGAVQLVEVSYTIGFRDGVGDLANASLLEVVAALEARGYEDGKAFNIYNIAAGGPGFQPKGLFLSALPYPLARALTVFQVDMRWRSVVTGEEATKDVHLAPRENPPLPGRRGLPPVRTYEEVMASRPEPEGDDRPWLN